VPGNARSGDYLSGIGIQARVPPRVTKLRSNVGVASLQRYVVGVEVKVPGPRRPKIVFTGARVERQPSGTIFLLEARNTGNVILQSVRGAATVSRGDRRVARAVIGPGTFVTRSAIDYPVPARAEQPREGDVYRVRATMRYRGGIARLDQRVRFGRKQAVAQEHFGGPPARSERSSSSWLPWTIGAAALAALGAAFAALIRRRRRTDGLTLVSRALEAASRTGEPVSVTAIGADGLDQRARKALAAAVRPRLRRADTLAELEKEGLVVVSPDTGPDAAAGLAAELRRSLAFVEGVRVGSATAQHPVEAAQLLGRARDAAHGPLPSVHTKSTR
jgi:hypothetical protein